MPKGLKQLCQLVRGQIGGVYDVVDFGVLTLFLQSIQLFEFGIPLVALAQSAVTVCTELVQFNTHFISPLHS